VAANDVKAGGAVVSLSADNAQLTAGLNAARAQIAELVRNTDGLNLGRRGALGQMAEVFRGGGMVQGLSTAASNFRAVGESMEQLAKGGDQAFENFVKGIPIFGDLFSGSMALGKALTGVARAEVEAEAAMEATNTSVAAQRAMFDLAAKSSKSYADSIGDVANQTALLGLKDQERELKLIDQETKKQIASKEASRDAEMQAIRDKAREEQKVLAKQAAETKTFSSDETDRARQARAELGQSLTVEFQQRTAAEKRFQGWKAEYEKSQAERVAKLKELADKQRAMEAMAAERTDAKTAADQLRQLQRGAKRAATPDDFEGRLASIDDDAKEKQRAVAEAAAKRAANAANLPFLDRVPVLAKIADDARQSMEAIEQERAALAEKATQEAVDARTMAELDAIDREAKAKAAAEELVSGLQRERLQEMEQAGDTEAGRALRVLEQEQRLKERIKKIEEAMPGASPADRLALERELAAAQQDLAGGVKLPDPETIAATLRSSSAGAFGANARFLSLGGDRMEIVAKATTSTAKSAERILAEVRAKGAYGP
jgi:hypothetical protein